METDHFGKSKEEDLIPDGKNVPVTNDNKLDYVEKLAYYKLY